jgi:hypothetical protein
MTPRTPNRAHPSGIPTPRPTFTAVLLLGAGGDVFVGEEEAAGEGVDVVVERVALGLEAVFVRELVKAAVLEELTIVVKGFKSPEMVKVPFPVWQLQSAMGSLSQQKALLPQLSTPASERELYLPDVALSGRYDYF